MIHSTHEIIENWFELLEDAREHYKCLRPPRASGALLVSKHGGRLISGVDVPGNAPSCEDIGTCHIVDGHCVRCIHAEQSVVALAARTMTSTQHATIYSINKPCYTCSKSIAMAGIDTIYYMFTVYDDEITRTLLEGSDIVSFHTSPDMLLDMLGNGDAKRMTELINNLHKGLS